jgi:hypothetical protein
VEQVRQPILIADSLIAQYRDVVRQFIQAWKDDNDPEMSVQRAHIERVYTGIWEQLDDAARTTQAAGRSIDAYLAIRHAPGLVVGAAIAGTSEKLVGIKDGLRMSTFTFQLKIHQNGEGLAAAEQAVAAMRAAWPELDFTPAPAPDVDLRPGGFLGRLFRRKR